MFFIFHSPAHDDPMRIVASLTAWLVAALIALPLLTIAAAVVYKLLRRSPRHRHAPPGQNAAELRRLQEAPAGPDEARTLHYLFVHRVLPDLAFEDPLQFMAILASPEAEQKLHELWMTVGKSLAEGRGDAQEVASSEGLSVTRTRLAGRACAVIEMPRPQAATEAYFVTAVLDHNLDQSRAAPPEAHPKLFYYTLEKATNLTDGSDRTMLCRWKTKTTHSNLGDGPPAEKKAFLEVIERMVTEQTRVGAGSQPAL
jgi:hypothetical protein